MLKDLLNIVNPFSSPSSNQPTPVKVGGNPEMLNHPKISRKLLRRMYQNSIPTDNWKEVRAFVEEIDPNFFSHLHRQLPLLEKNEARLCTLIYLGRSTKEIANILGLRVEQIRRARTRLRRRLQLPETFSLYQGLQYMLADQQTILNLAA